jgi:photosystem II stability/assembly factor-like uncharacterized protein
MIEAQSVEDIVYALVAAPDFVDNNICLAACHSGVRMSNDGGKIWYPVEIVPGVPNSPPATALAVSPDFPTAGTILVGVPGGVVRSTDGGHTWTSAALASPPPFVTALAVSPDFVHDGMVFAATLEDGIFRSSDHGKTWQSWNFGLFDLNILGLAVSSGFARDRTIYAASETGIYLSKNRGRAWQETHFPADCAPVLCMALSPQFAYDGVLLAGTEASGLFYSDDTGHSWLHVSQLKTTNSINAILLSPDFPQIPEILVITNDMLWMSNDAGQSWSVWQSVLDFSAGLATAAAPVGLRKGCPLLLGLADGRVLRVDPS